MDRDRREGLALSGALLVMFTALAAIGSFLENDWRYLMLTWAILAGTGLFSAGIIVVFHGIHWLLGKLFRDGC